MVKPEIILVVKYSGGSSLVTLGLELLRVSGSPFRLYVSDKFSEKCFVFLIVFLEVHSLKKF